MDIGSRMSQIRKERNMTLQQITDITKLSQPFLSEVERGIKTPSIKNLEKICSALNMTPSEFFNCDETSECIPLDISRFATDQKNHGLIRLIQAMEESGYSPDVVEDWIHALNSSLEAIEKKLIERKVPMGEVIWAEDKYIIPEEKLTEDEKEIRDKLRDRIKDPGFKPPWG